MNKPTLKALLTAHATVGGQTNTGKSYFVQKKLLEGAKRLKDLVIYVNPQHEPIKVKNFKIIKEFNLRRILRAKWVNFYCDDNETLDMLVEALLKLGERGFSSYIAIDEAHLFAKAKNLAKIPRMGRKYNVHQTTISQRLNDIQGDNRAVITQSRYIILFSLSRFELPILRYYQLSDLMNYNLPQYHFIVFDSVEDKVFKFKPI